MTSYTDLHSSLERDRLRKQRRESRKWKRFCFFERMVPMVLVALGLALVGGSLSGYFPAQAYIIGFCTGAAYMMLARYLSQRAEENIREAEERKASHARED